MNPLAQQPVRNDGENPLAVIGIPQHRAIQALVVFPPFLFRLASRLRQIRAHILGQPAKILQRVSARNDSARILVSLLLQLG
ncbi:hypothetical protein JOC55_002199 [Paenibacillus sacheonensis]|nr:hypothetical protein [Paenibacillus sacheonensis]